MPEYMKTASAWIALVVVGVILALGLGTGFQYALRLEITTGWLLAIFSWLAGIAVVLILTLVMLFTYGRLVDLATTRIADPSKNYTAFVGLFAGVCGTIVASVLGDDPYLSVAVGVAMTALATSAAQAIKSHPRAGYALYAGVAVVCVVAVAATTSAAEVRTWLAERTLRDWGLIVFIIVTAVGVPLSVWAIERVRDRAGAETVTHALWRLPRHGYR